ncbi:uncharacterized protein B0I36DRAFT_351992 [Microdochium trichocladiopsis]|uniref:C3H1-type domain-containing protein n=1 Tax=Microdochium trichocladiopsis TaxID=1682393 RepID=A0A9P8Y2N5_9PEZI|nr:uncharacterized protein B0I36DRAFT_351992 [Microdochium trichocladiopsis]KAH7026077.1 hypothetical protein B0I36DRAFT_351992 [Microdochium trichocladiopsis]
MESPLASKSLSAAQGSLPVTSPKPEQTKLSSSSPRKEHDAINIQESSSTKEQHPSAAETETAMNRAGHGAADPAAPTQDEDEKQEVSDSPCPSPATADNPTPTESSAAPTNMIPHLSQATPSSLVGVPPQTVPVEAAEMSRGISVFVSEQQLRSSYTYCYDRGNGTYSRLVALDMLPPLDNVSTTQENCLGMIVLPEPAAPAPPGGEMGVLNAGNWKASLNPFLQRLPEKHVPLPMLLLADAHADTCMHSEQQIHDGSSTSERVLAGDVQSTIDSIVETTTPTTNRVLTFPSPRDHFTLDTVQQQPHHRQQRTHAPRHNDASTPSSTAPARNSNKRVKIYCDKWVHEGVCAFTQQGCKFKHEMPMDKATQHQLGLFHGLPAWWRKQQAEAAKHGGDLALQHQQQYQQQMQPLYMLQPGMMAGECESGAQDIGNLAQPLQGLQMNPEFDNNNNDRGNLAMLAQHPFGGTGENQQQFQHQQQAPSYLPMPDNAGNYPVANHSGPQALATGGAVSNTAAFFPSATQPATQGLSGSYYTMPQFVQSPGQGAYDEDDLTLDGHGNNPNGNAGAMSYGQSAPGSDLPLRRGYQGHWDQHQHFGPMPSFIGSGIVQSVPTSQGPAGMHAGDRSRGGVSATSRDEDDRHLMMRTNFNPHTIQNTQHDPRRAARSMPDPPSTGRTGGGGGGGSFASRFGPIAPPPAAHALTLANASPLTATGLSMVSNTNAGSPFRSSGSSLRGHGGGGGTPAGVWKSSATRPPFSASAATFPVLRQAQHGSRQQRDVAHDHDKHQHANNQAPSQVGGGFGSGQGSSSSSQQSYGGHNNMRNVSAEIATTTTGSGLGKNKARASHENRNPWRSVSESDGTKGDGVNKEW